MPLSSWGKDARIFLGACNGQFSCKATYRALTMQHQFLQAGRWKKIWHLKIPEKLRSFLWLCQHNRLATNDLLYSRSILANLKCVRCGFHCETVEHVLLECPFATEMWFDYIGSRNWQRVYDGLGENWLDDLVFKQQISAVIWSSVSWLLVCVSLMWHVWKNRNEFVFNGQDLPLSSQIYRVKEYVEQLVASFPTLCSAGKQKLPARTVWQPPPPSWFKLNTDASLLSVSGSVAGGGLIRYDKGAWIGDFSRKFYDVSINTAELLALRDGLAFAWERRLPRVEVELDSEVIFKLFSSPDTCKYPLHFLLEDRRSFSRLPWDFYLKHTKRGGNKCADYLAKLGHDVIGFELWTYPPDPLVDLLRSDVEDSPQTL